MKREIQKQLNNTIIEIVKNRNTDTAEDMLDESIIELIVEFCKKHNEFHVYDETIVYADYPKGTLGMYRNSTKQVIVTTFLIQNISKRIVNLGYTRLIEHLIITILHEHRHAWQYHNDKDMIRVKQVKTTEDYEGYWNHPMEVDARMAADKYMAYQELVKLLDKYLLKDEEGNKRIYVPNVYSEYYCLSYT